MDYIDIEEKDLVYKPLWYHLRGLMQTATGYGSKLVTENMVKYEGRLRRIYAHCYSNCATLYIIVNGEKRIIRR